MLTVVPKLDKESIGTALLEILMVKISTDSTILSVRTEMLLTVHLLASPVENVMTSSRAVKSIPISFHSKFDESKMVFTQKRLSIMKLLSYDTSCLTDLQ